MKPENINMDRTFFREAQNFQQEPAILESDSSDSKYSNEDREDKDHLLHGEAAIMRAMDKLKNASRIVEKNEIIKKSANTSHLVAYFDLVNRQSLIPKPLGMVHRKIPAHIIDVHDQVFANACPFANALNRAKYVNFLNLRNTSLKDEQAIEIIDKMDKAVLTHLDLSENPLLTKKFYEQLIDMINENVCNLQRLEIEANKIDKIALKNLCEALSKLKSFQMLNVSNCNINDRDAKVIASMIKESYQLKMLFMNNNRVMGEGSVLIADAIA